MAGGRKAPRWRGAFLRGLRRSGNVAAAARAAGVHKSTAYLRRQADAGFAAQWDAAAAAGKAAVGAEGKAAAGSKGKAAAAKRPRHRPPGGPPPRGERGEEWVLRDSKNGAQLVRAGPGRWSPAIEQAFLADYAQSGSIRRAARAAGVSATIIHYRKRRYPGFAAACAAAEARATERLHGLVTAAGIASFDPDLAEAELPKVSVAEAIAILRLKGSGAARGRGGAPLALPSIEQVRAEVVGRIAAIRRHREERERSDDGA